MQISNPLEPLIQELSKLPSIGPRSASRLAFYFLSMPKKEVFEFAKILTNTKNNIKYCQKCFNISVQEFCNICQNQERDHTKLCIVAEPKDIFALERMGEYNGMYHVLGGLISPLDGIYPELLRLDELQKRLQIEPISEILFAINPSIEGDATVLFLQNILKDFKIILTRLAYGLPLGSELDYADENTLKKAFQNRTRISS